MAAAHSPVHNGTTVYQLGSLLDIHPELQDQQPTEPVNMQNECQICYDSIHETDTVARVFQRECCTTGKFCGSCLKTYITLIITEQRLADLVCPEPRCQVKLTENVVAEAVPKELVKRLKDLQYELAETQRRSQKSWSRRLYDEMTMASWELSTDTRRCPKCSVIIQKNGGCPHMRCVQCCHEFYWCCGTTYSAKHNPITCKTLSFARSKSILWGPAPLRPVTKTIAAATGASVALAGVGLVGAGCGVAIGGILVYGTTVFPVQAYFAYRERQQPGYQSSDDIIKFYEMKRQEEWDAYQLSKKESDLASTASESSLDSTSNSPVPERNLETGIVVLGDPSSIAA